MTQKGKLSAPEARTVQAGGEGVSFWGSFSTPADEALLELLFSFSSFELCRLCCIALGHMKIWIHSWQGQAGHPPCFKESECNYPNWSRVNMEKLTYGLPQNFTSFNNQSGPLVSISSERFVGLQFHAVIFDQFQG